MSTLQRLLGGSVACMCLLALIGQASVAWSSQDDGVYSVSDRANALIVIESSEPETDFFVDGTHVGRGKIVRVRVEKREKYTIRAQPEGYTPREDTIHPPHSEGRRVRFQFLIQDRIRQGNPGPEPGIPGSTNTAGSISVIQPPTNTILKTSPVLLNLRLDGGLPATGVRLWVNEKSRDIVLEAGAGASGSSATRDLTIETGILEGRNTIRVEAVGAGGVLSSHTIVLHLVPGTPQ